MNAELVAQGFDALDRAAVPAAFAWRVLQLSRADRGMEMLLELFIAEADSGEREAILADMGELIDDHEPTAAPPESALVDDLGAEVVRRRQSKARLRQLVEQHGGVSAVARAAGMAQPSLSRLLNSGSQPRAGTLKRLADAMDVTVEELSKPMERPMRRQPGGGKRLAEPYVAQRDWTEAERTYGRLSNVRAAP